MALIATVNRWIREGGKRGRREEKREEADDFLESLDKIHPGSGRTSD